MKIFILIIAVFTLVSTHSLPAQSFTFHGGVSPNNLKGTHLSFKADVLQKKKWLYTVNYSLVKYVDSYAHPNISQPGFHIENKRDRTFIDLPELDRGMSIQYNERDFRPSFLNHRFSLFLGYEVISNSNFSVKGYLGPHFSVQREILYYISYNFTPVEVNEGDETIILPYHDFQIYRYWDIGPGARVDADYWVFQNVSLGLSSQMYFDLLGEGIDLIVGGGITYKFNSSK